jgi:hypothetical protein
LLVCVARLLREDLLLILGDLERRHHLLYVDTYDVRNPKPGEWSRASDISDLSRARHETGGNGASYLIVTEGTKVIQAPFVQRDGTKRFDIWEVNNPNSMTVFPGGEWKNDIILAGEFVTMSNTTIAQQLIRAAYSGIRKHFIKVGYHYWVGPQALTRFNSGTRLTIAEQSPAEFDLRDMPSPKSAARTQSNMAVDHEEFETMTVEKALKVLSSQQK